MCPKFTSKAVMKSLEIKSETELDNEQLQFRWSNATIKELHKKNLKISRKLIQYTDYSYHANSGSKPICFYLDIFCKRFLRSFCRISIVLWLPVWHQYFALFMFACYLEYHWIRVVHTEKQSILKCSSVLIHNFILVSFYQWSIFFSSFEKHNTNIEHSYNMFIQQVQHTLIQHETHTTRLYNTLIQRANQKN